MKVAIPQTFFFEEAKSEHSNIAKRLVAELIQNSFDAGATEIRLEFKDRGYSCSDNGTGMSRERMVQAMLTLGGSVKPAGATGGFGAAKKLILFAHKEFCIHSLDTCAKGSVLDYEFVPCSFYQGTKVSVEYFEGFPFGRMESDAKEFLSASNFAGRCRVFINDEEFTSWCQWGNLFDSNNTWDVYVSDEKSWYVNVYHNGLFMFARFVGEMNKAVRINVKLASKQVFTQNRDSFKADYSISFDELCNKIVQDPKTGLSKRPQARVWNGRLGLIKAMFNKAAQVLSVNELEVLAVAIKENKHKDYQAIITALENAGHNTLAQKISAEVISSGLESINYNFYIRHNGDIDESRYSPQTGLKKYRFLASLYKTCLLEIMRIEERNLNFAVGFIFEDDIRGLYQRDNNVFYINPVEKLAEGDIKARVYEVLMIAIHEYCHIDFPRHNEEYASSLTFTTARVLANMRGYTDLVKEARENENNF